MYRNELNYYQMLLALNGYCLKGDILSGVFICSMISCRYRLLGSVAQHEIILFSHGKVQELRIVINCKYNEKE